MEEGSKKQMELPWMEGMLFNKNITFGTVLDGRNGVREILFRGKVVFFWGGQVPWKEGRLFFFGGEVPWW